MPLEETTDWWSSPQTKKFIERTKDQVNAAGLELEKACRETTDPKVAAAFTKWKLQQAFLDSFAKRAGQS